MPYVILETHALQELGGFVYRIVADTPSVVTYEVQGQKDAMGVGSWIEASPEQRVKIKDDLVQEYLGDLYTRAMTKAAEPRHKGELHYKGELH